MRKWFLILAMGMFLVLPSMASAQGSVTLASLNVQLWPEYDQPSMLVLTDFELPATTLFPVKMTFHIPQDANLVAVASYSADGSLVNAIYEGPTKNGDLQAFTVTLNNPKARFEYYLPLMLNEHERTFSYLWNGDYAINAFGIRVLEPLDSSSLTTTPKLGPAVVESGLTYYESGAVKLKNGEQFTLDLKYTKTTDTLVSPQGIQPAAPVDENTPGRVSLNNSLPYIIGGIGIVMVVGGIVYYWQAGRSSTKKPRRRIRTSQENEEDTEEAYCPQCGTRAKSNDRFCRVCGGRMRHQEE